MDKKLEKRINQVNFVIKLKAIENYVECISESLVEIRGMLRDLQSEYKDEDFYNKIYTDC